MLRGSDAWRTFGDSARSFHHYSLNNLMLILAQRPTATWVAGDHQRQAKSRQVRKGERGIRIFGYAQNKVAEDEDVTTTEAGEKITTYSPVLTVFDIDQTDLLIEGADDPSTLAHHLPGNEPLGIVDAVTDYLTGLGWTVEHTPITSRSNGSTTTDDSRRVVVDTTLSPAHAAKTALHEAAHVILAAERDVADDVERRRARRAQHHRIQHRLDE